MVVALRSSDQLARVGLAETLGAGVGCVDKVGARLRVGTGDGSGVGTPWAMLVLQRYVVKQ